MADFRQCRVEFVKYHQKLFYNSPMNMDKVYSFYKTQRKYYPDNEGIPAICFIMGLKKDDTTWDGFWCFNNEEQRDETYASLLAGN